MLYFIVVILLHFNVYISFVFLIFSLLIIIIIIILLWIPYYNLCFYLYLFYDDCIIIFVLL